MSNALQTITGDIYATRESFEAVLTDRSINFEREAGFAVQIIQASDYMLKTALNNRQSVVNAVTNIAAIGLSLNPAKKHAYLVPRKVNGSVAVCLDISYMGLIELAVASGSVLLAQARVVYAKDHFKDNGPGLLPTHETDPFAKDRGDIVGVYAAAKLPSGDWMAETMSVNEVNDIRDRSESYKSGKSCPWKTDWAEMAKKTVIKRASKYWPKTERLKEGVHFLNTDGGEGLAEVAANNHGAPVVSEFNADEWIRKVESANTDAAVMEVYHAAGRLIAATRDLEGGSRFKKAAVARRTYLANQTFEMEKAA